MTLIDSKIQTQQDGQTMKNLITEMTEEKILELATYFFYKEKTGWSGVTDETIIKFAVEIQTKILEQIIAELQKPLEDCND